MNGRSRGKNRTNLKESLSESFQIAPLFSSAALSWLKQIKYQITSQSESILLPSLEMGAGMGFLPLYPCPPDLKYASWESFFFFVTLSGFSKLEMFKQPTLFHKGHLVAC